MGTTEKPTKVSRAVFLDYLDSIEGKAEYLNGEIYDMAGGSIPHSLIEANISGEMRTALLGSICKVFSSNLTIQIESDGSIVFPDASVFCGKPETTPDRKDIATNPTLIVEVLSPSNMKWDRGGKLLKYWTIPSLVEYVIIEQTHPQVDVYTKSPNGEWVFSSYQDLEDVVSLNSLGIKIPLSGIYLGVEFES